MEKHEFVLTLTIILSLSAIALLLHTKTPVSYSEYYIVPSSYNNYVNTPQNYSFEYVIKNHEGKKMDYNIKAVFNNETFYEKEIELNNNTTFTDTPFLEINSLPKNSRIYLNINNGVENKSLWINLFNKISKINDFIIKPKEKLIIDEKKFINSEISFNIEIADNEVNNYYYKVLNEDYEIFKENLIKNNLTSKNELTINFKKTILVPLNSYNNFSVELYNNDNLVDKVLMPENYFALIKLGRMNMPETVFNGSMLTNLTKNTVSITLINNKNTSVLFNITLESVSKKCVANAMSSCSADFTFYKTNETSFKVPLKIRLIENKTMNPVFNITMIEGCTNLSSIGLTIKERLYELDFSKTKIILRS